MTIKLSKNGKRLGRPPKEKDNNPKTFVISSTYEEPKFELTDALDMIECSLIPINEYSHIDVENKKAGRYATSTYSVGRFGKNAYVVLAYIQTDINEHRKNGIKDEQIVLRCVNYLNQEVKTARKSYKPYGNLQLYGYNVINKFGKDIFAVELVTDNRTNDNFWGSGNR